MLAKHMEILDNDICMLCVVLYETFDSIVISISDKREISL